MNDQELEAIIINAKSILPLWNLDVYTQSDFERALNLSGMSLFQGKPPIYTEDEKTKMIRRLEEHFNVQLSLGVIFGGQKHEKWLKQSSNLTWYYWERYRKFLEISGKVSPTVVSVTHEVTDAILDYMENPQRPEDWKNRGLVVGYVQSGKTLNYTGLICKASDAGYKVIIVLSGILNSLRRQTQIRIEEGFSGINSAPEPNESAYVGVSNIDKSRNPYMGTRRNRDFTEQIAAALPLDALKEPAVFVVKKNRRVLTDLLSWLTRNNTQLRKYPLLIIDDEADNASINTRHNRQEIAVINGLIRDLLKVFNRSSYVGYTATPFANIFIDPATEHAMRGDDLFPKDFIYSLDPPTNYFGPDKVFPQNTEFVDSPFIRLISSDDPLFPMAHQRDFTPAELTEDLKKAICCFLLVCSIRNLRRHRGQHNSMMINVSRFTGVQTNVKHLVINHLELLKNAILNNCGLTQDEALENPLIKFIFDVWSQEYSLFEFPWIIVQKELLAVAPTIDVIEVNNASTSALLDYDKHKSGWNVIAIGGLSLSRGITLEGLSVSYLLRNTQMYDTLMQMGRWFGYRPEYEDLCRIYTTVETAGWYQHIADVLSEMRTEFKAMREQDKTPAEFGLRVRQHPESLLITAKLKIGLAHEYDFDINLTGRTVETTRIFYRMAERNANWEAAKSLLLKCFKEAEKSDDLESGTNIFRNVSRSVIEDFITKFRNHPLSRLTEFHALCSCLRRGCENVDVAFVSVRQKKDMPSYFEPLKIHALTRNNVSLIEDDAGIEFNQRRVGAGDSNRIGLTNNETRTIPMLMIYVVDCYYKKQGTDENIPVLNTPLIAYGITFPGQIGDTMYIARYLITEQCLRQLESRSELIGDGDDELDAINPNNVVVNA